MAWQSPLDPLGTDKAALIDVMEWCYLYIFTFELVAKIFAYGFIYQEGSYLHDAWCQLDFVVVGLAWIPILFVRAPPPVSLLSQTLLIGLVIKQKKHVHARQSQRKSKARSLGYLPPTGGSPGGGAECSPRRSLLRSLKASLV